MACLPPLPSSFGYDLIFIARFLRAHLFPFLRHRPSFPGPLLPWPLLSHKTFLLGREHDKTATVARLYPLPASQILLQPCIRQTPKTMYLPLPPPCTYAGLSYLLRHFRLPSFSRLNPPRRFAAAPDRISRVSQTLLSSSSTCPKPGAVCVFFFLFFPFAPI